MILSTLSIRVDLILLYFAYTSGRSLHFAGGRDVYRQLAVVHLICCPARKLMVSDTPTFHSPCDEHVNKLRPVIVISDMASGFVFNKPVTNNHEIASLV